MAKIFNTFFKICSIHRALNYIIYLLALACANICMAAPEGKIFDVAKQQNISAQSLIDQLKKADIVLIGEQHSNPKHHEAEIWLLNQTKDSRAHGAVVLEMLNTSQQQAVADVHDWLQHGGKTSIDRLPNKLDWNSKWSWQLYGLLMQDILMQPAQIKSGNPNQDILKSPQAMQFIPKGKNAGNPEVSAALAKLMEINHASDGHMVSMQQFKDNTMAQALLSAPKPAWLIAGAIHVSKKLGVPLFLQDAHYLGHLKTVILTDNDSMIDDAHADYIWYLKSHHSTQPNEKE